MILCRLPVIASMATPCAVSILTDNYNLKNISTTLFFDALLSQIPDDVNHAFNTSNDHALKTDEVVITNKIDTFIKISTCFKRSDFDLKSVSIPTEENVNIGGNGAQHNSRSIPNPGNGSTQLRYAPIKSSAHRHGSIVNDLDLCSSGFKDKSWIKTRLSNAVPIVNLTETRMRFKSPPINFTLCVAPIFGTAYDWMDVIKFVEINRVLG